MGAYKVTVHVKCFTNAKRSNKRRPKQVAGKKGINPTCMIMVTKAMSKWLVRAWPISSYLAIEHQQEIDWLN